MYSRRQLLALRRVGGKVTWNDNRQVIVGATIKAYDSDTLSAKDFMGEATTNADGGYVITYEDRQWDTFDRYPDIKIEVYIGGKLYYTSSESTDTTSNSLNKPLSVPRYIATGIVKYHETCEGAVGVTATLFDSDWPTADVEMGSAQTNNDGKYSIHAPVSEWDLLGNNPDPYVVFTKDGSELGKTEIKSDTAATAMNYGTLTIWRGDKNSSALSIQNSMSDAKKQDYITVTEYGHCSPKRMVVTITVKFELSVFDPPPSNEVSRLKSMVKNGIQDNWSRTGSRAIAVSGGEKYDVYVKVVEGTSDYYPVSLHWDDGDNAKCARSNNIGLPLTTLAMWYNIGCAKKLFPSTWRAAADNDFMDTAGSFYFIFPPFLYSVDLLICFLVLSQVTNGVILYCNMPRI
jgi:hypothetical protein